MRSCDQAKVAKTYLRALGRAEALGYRTLEDCIIARIISGETVRGLAGKLDVSESWLQSQMNRLNVRTTNSRKTRFWRPNKAFGRDF